jgi:Ca-activated chloride channel family protein
MNIDANDPRLTAYALGELKDEKERAEIEKLVNESPELSKLVEEIRQTAGFLTNMLHSEAALELTPAQRDRIESKARAGGNWFRLRPAWALVGVAAALLLILSISINPFRRGERSFNEEKSKSLVAAVQNKSVSTPQSTKPEIVEKPAVAEHRSAAIDETAKTRASKKSEDKIAVMAQKTPQAQSGLILQPAKPEIVVKSAAAEHQQVLDTTTAPKEIKESKVEIAALTRETPQVQSVPPSSTSKGQKAEISGRVEDATKAILPGVSIIATNTENGISHSSQTNASGRYQFTGLPSGTYDVKAELKGFKTFEYQRVPLGDLAQARLNFTLEVSPVEEVIDVKYEAAVAMLDKAPSVGVVIPEDRIASSHLNLQRDGVPVSDIRYATGLNSPAQFNPDLVGEFKMVLKPVDAAMRHRKGAKFNTEAYDNIVDNPFLEVVQNPLSTFSIDVDTASYTNARRYLDGGTKPPKGAVRIEELINYFDYSSKGPSDNKPFAAHFDIVEAPWNKEHRLIRIGLKAREIETANRPPINLVFLLDVSGSMADENKLPLVKESMRLLVDQLTEADKVAIVTYAGSSGVALPSTSGYQKETLRAAINRLWAGGSTNGASGIQLAYEIAQKCFIKGGANRVILTTDGDFNVGITNQGDLANLIEEKAKSGIFLSVLGFGMGNYKDSNLELLAKKGHGNYAYIDTLDEAKKVLVQQINGTLISVAKDVKIQVEFNPQRVGAYRLIGYEDRVMPKEDFNDDTKDAGVIGAGHTVTALYEIVPPGKPIPLAKVDPLKYQKPGKDSSAASSDEVLTVKIRYKEPEQDKSLLLEFPVKDKTEKFSAASEDFKFASAVAAFGMILRDSPYKGSVSLEQALEWAKEGKGADKNGYRQEFIRLLHRAISIK